MGEKQEQKSCAPISAPTYKYKISLEPEGEKGNPLHGKILPLISTTRRYLPSQQLVIIRVRTAPTQRVNFISVLKKFKFFVKISSWAFKSLKVFQKVDWDIPPSPLIVLSNRCQQVGQIFLTPSQLVLFHPTLDILFRWYFYDALFSFSFSSKKANTFSSSLPPFLLPLSIFKKILLWKK